MADTARNEMLKSLYGLEACEPVGLTATADEERPNSIKMTWGINNFVVMYYQHAWGFRIGYIEGANMARLLKND